MNWGKQQSGINKYCCWCRKDIPENTPVYGLTARFRKDAEATHVTYLVPQVYLIESFLPGRSGCQSA